MNIIHLSSEETKDLERSEHLSKTEDLAIELIHNSYIYDHDKLHIDLDVMRELAKHLGLEFVEVPF